MAQIKRFFAKGYIDGMKTFVSPNSRVAAEMQYTALLGASHEISPGEERSAIENLLNSIPDLHAREAGRHGAYAVLSGIVLAVGAVNDITPGLLDAVMVYGGILVGTRHGLSTMKESAAAWSISRNTHQYSSIDDVAKA